MAKEFSTSKADYLQVYEMHFRPTKDRCFEEDSVDAVVLELYHSPEWFEKYWRSPIRDNHKQILDFAQRTGKNIYVVDVMTTRAADLEDPVNLTVDIAGAYLGYVGINNMRESINKEWGRRTFLKSLSLGFLQAGTGLFFASHIGYESAYFASGKAPSPVAELHSARTHLVPSPRFELRNAIWARKIEEFIVPELEGSLKRRPNLALVCGAGHTGLKDDLQHPTLRNAYIGAFSAAGYPGINTEYLDTVTAVTLDSKGMYQLHHKNCNLF